MERFYPMSPKFPAPDESPSRPEVSQSGSDDFPPEPRTLWERLLGHLLRPWHLFRIWLLTLRIRKQRRDLAKYVRRSAYEITAWKQDIRFLAEQREYHLRRARMRRERPPAEFKVVPLPDVKDKGKSEPLP